MHPLPTCFTTERKETEGEIKKSNMQHDSCNPKKGQLLPYLPRADDTHFFFPCMIDSPVYFSDNTKDVKSRTKHEGTARAARRVVVIQRDFIFLLSYSPLAVCCRRAWRGARALLSRRIWKRLGWWRFCSPSGTHASAS